MVFHLLNWMWTRTSSSTKAHSEWYATSKFVYGTATSYNSFSSLKTGRQHSYSPESRLSMVTDTKQCAFKTWLLFLTGDLTLNSLYLNSSCLVFFPCSHLYSSVFKTNANHSLCLTLYQPTLTVAFAIMHAWSPMSPYDVFDACFMNPIGNSLKKQ